MRLLFTRAKKKKKKPENVDVTKRGIQTLTKLLLKIIIIIIIIIIILEKQTHTQGREKLIWILIQMHTTTLFKSHSNHNSTQKL